MTFAKLMASLEVKIEDNTANFETLGYFSNSAWPRLPIITSVPNILRQVNVQAYTPSVVCIGPLHSRKEHLQAMEADKLSYMRFLFQRIKNPEETRKECLVAMLQMKERFKKCYPDQAAAKQLQGIGGVTSSTSLVEMMLIDGCFIIELVYRYHTNEQDPILNNPFMYSAVRRDLLLLENQIPFFVLENLFSLTVERIEFPYGNPTPTLIGCLLSFFGDIMGLEDTSRDISRMYRWLSPYHILHLLHYFYQPRVPNNEGASRVPELGTTATQRRQRRGVSAACGQDQQPAGYEGTATQLHNEGIKLRKRSCTSKLFDVKFSTHDRNYVYFWRGGLEIPRFSIYDFTESVLRNLIAFEQCYHWMGISCFTSHAFLMDILMDSVEDVKLLEKAGVICNHLGSSESVLQIFNGICKNALPQHFDYDELWNDMKRFRKPWRKQLGTVKHNCAGNPWIVLSVVGAFVLFVLTLLQTAYSMRAYYHPPA
ncbi:putative UPF0481 protein At3g02645 isoform X2 [Cornus florida]|nr:putative UPF0481 protein At3g02645 isoform X2 [Cornus florida]